jgi:sigma-E factor negative regulatory protein RseC
MEEIGVVRTIEGLVAKVAIPRKSACEGCTVETCKPDEQSMVVEALNPVKARVGQKVKVVFKPYSYVKGTFIVYGIPALAIIGGAVLGRFFSNYFREIDADVLSALFGFGAFAISLLAVKLWSKKAEKKVGYKPVIEEIVE